MTLGGTPCRHWRLELMGYIFSNVRLGNSSVTEAGLIQNTQFLCVCVLVPSIHSGSVNNTVISTVFCNFCIFQTNAFIHSYKDCQSTKFYSHLATNFIEWRWFKCRKVVFVTTPLISEYPIKHNPETTKIIFIPQ